MKKIGGYMGVYRYETLPPIDAQNFPGLPPLHQSERLIKLDRDLEKIENSSTDWQERCAVRRMRIASRVTSPLGFGQMLGNSARTTGVSENVRHYKRAANSVVREPDGGVRWPANKRKVGILRGRLSQACYDVARKHESQGHFAIDQSGEPYERKARKSKKRKRIDPIDVHARQLIKKYRKAEASNRWAKKI
jgi:hypothetical protein